MQFRDCFPCFSHETICFFPILRVCMVWFKCRTENSFLLFVCFESNAAHEVLFFFLYLLSEMQYRDCFPGFFHERIIFFKF